MTASTIIRDATVVSMRQAALGSECQALAIEGGRILAVGTNEDIDTLAGPGTQIFGLSGCTVLPGFIDSHVHFMQLGLGLLGPSVRGLTSIDSMLAAIADASASTDLYEPLLVHGYDAGTAARPLGRLDLDRVCLHRPIVVADVGCHACVVNTAAMAMLCLPPTTVGIRRLSTHEPSGVLVAQANSAARSYFYGMLSDSTRVRALRQAAELAVRHGITTVHALEGGSADGHGWMPQRDLEVLLKEKCSLPVRVVPYFQSTNVAQALAWNLPSIGGCLCVDGSYGEHTAALLEPYADDPGTRGELYFSDRELSGFVERAHLAGLQISMHAMGDAAIEQLLNAYERALTLWPRVDHRHRIEHFSLPTEQQIQRAARLGVAVAMQPNFALMPETGASDDHHFANARVLGSERNGRRHPYRKILDAGILVAGGSDADAGELGPLLGIHALVNHPDKDRRLTPFEALELYTTGSAQIGLEERVKGALETGMAADLVILAQNPLTADPRVLREIGVVMTIVAGKVVYPGTSMSWGTGSGKHNPSAVCK